MEKGKLLPRGSDIGILRKLLLITSSRRLGVRVNKPINLERLISEGQNRKHLQREIISPLEALHDHPLVTTSSHFTPQKGKRLK
jgi:hypothetical protein